jgi:glycosyltransferase involved in cell wall biosynthesis
MDISIIIPFYNHTHYLIRLLKNIYNQEIVKKGLLTYEIIIIIDSIESEITELELSIQEAIGFDLLEHIHFIKNATNLGVADSRNIGIKASYGNWLHIVDQDDEFNSDFYRLVKDNETNNTEFILVNGLFKYESQNFTHKIYYLKPSINLKNFILDDFIRSPGQVLFKKSILNGVYFRTAKCHRGCDDRFFWIELFNNNDKIKTHYSYTCFYVANIHTNNFSLDSMQLYHCSVELWEQIDGSIMANYQKYVRANKACLNYITKNNSSLYNLYCYIVYKYKPYRSLRFLFKNLKVYKQFNKGTNN